MHELHPHLRIPIPWRPRPAVPVASRQKSCLSEPCLLSLPPMKIVKYHSLLFNAWLRGLFYSEGNNFVCPLQLSPHERLCPHFKRNLGVLNKEGK